MADRRFVDVVQQAACADRAGAVEGTPAAIAGTDAAPTKRWGKARPYLGTVLAMEGLCAVRAADDKDTVRVEIDLGDSGLRYEPGDALGIYPRNCPEASLLQTTSPWKTASHASGSLPRN